MSAEQKKPEQQIPEKYRRVENAGAYRGVIPGKHEKRDPANRKRHVPQNQIAEGTDFDVFD